MWPTSGAGTRQPIKTIQRIDRTRFSQVWVKQDTDYTQTLWMACPFNALETCASPFPCRPYWRQVPALRKHLSYRVNDPTEISICDRTFQKQTCPELSTSFLNQITFNWFTGLAVKGYKRPLEREDLWSVNERDRADNLIPQFYHNFRQQFKGRSKIFKGWMILLTSVSCAGLYTLHV